MAGDSKIEWCDATFSPWWGCERVSPGCAHCYADSIAKWRGHQIWGPDHGFRFLSDDTWKKPLRWAKLATEGRLPNGQPNVDGHRPRVFCASMADVFEERSELVPHRVRLFDLISRTPELDWLILTKRPEFARYTLTRNDFWRAVNYRREDVGEDYLGFTGDGLPNVWMGVSIENARYTWRADVLREIPAAVRFISAEPLLGSLFEPQKPLGDPEDWEHFADCDDDWPCSCLPQMKKPLDLAGIDWVIIGGESGGGARPFHLEHAREIIKAALAQCGTCERVMGAGGVARACEQGDSRPYGICDRSTAVFVKQLGAKPCYLDDLTIGVYKDRPLKLNDRKGGDMSEWPADLRIREFPTNSQVAFDTGLMRP